MVKYANCPTADVEVVIEAPPAEVWPFVVDIDLPARFSPEFQGGRWVSDGSPVPGSVFEGTNKHDAVGEWTTTCTVTDLVPERVFEWTVGDIDDKTARWRFDLSPEGAGSRLRFSAEMGPGPSGLSMAIAAMPDKEEKIVANRLDEWKRNMRSTLDGIKALAEGTEL